MDEIKELIEEGVTKGLTDAATETDTTKLMSDVADQLINVGEENKALLNIENLTYVDNTVDGKDLVKAAVVIAAVSGATITLINKIPGGVKWVGKKAKGLFSKKNTKAEVTETEEVVDVEATEVTEEQPVKEEVKSEKKDKKTK